MAYSTTPSAPAAGSTLTADGTATIAGLVGTEASFVLELVDATGNVVARTSALNPFGTASAPGGPGTFAGLTDDPHANTLLAAALAGLTNDTLTQKQRIDAVLVALAPLQADPTTKTYVDGLVATITNIDAGQASAIQQLQQLLAGDDNLVKQLLATQTTHTQQIGALTQRPTGTGYGLTLDANNAYTLDDNPLDLGGGISGQQVNPATGKLVLAAGLTTSNGYASNAQPPPAAPAVTPGQTYKSNFGILNGAWYDVHGNYLAPWSASTTGASAKVSTAPAGANFVQVSLQTSLFNQLHIAPGSSSYDDTALKARLTTDEANLALIQAQLFGQNRGAWAANTAYAQYDFVTYSGTQYYANQAFTSGAAFVASNWTVGNLAQVSNTALSSPVMGYSLVTNSYRGYPSLAAATQECPAITLNAPAVTLTTSASGGFITSSSSGIAIGSGKILTLAGTSRVQSTNFVNGSGKGSIVINADAVTNDPAVGCRLLQGTCGVAVTLQQDTSGANLVAVLVLEDYHVDNVGGTGYLHLYGTSSVTTVAPTVTVVDHRNASSGGGIDYANPVLHTAAATLAAADNLKLHTLNGSDFTLTLPPTPATGYHIRLKVEYNAAGLYTIDGNGSTIGGDALVLLWAAESLDLTYTGSYWLVLTYDRRLASIRVRTDTNQSIGIPTGGYMRMPYTVQVRADSPLVGVLDASSDPDVTTSGVNIRRKGRVRVDAALVLSGTAAGSFYQVDTTIHHADGSSEIITISLITSADAGGAVFAMGSVTGSIPVLPGDHINCGVYAKGGGQVRQLANQPTTLTITEE